MNFLFSSEVTEPRSSCGKIFSLVPEIPVGKTEFSEAKADHRSCEHVDIFWEGSKDVSRSRKPAQPGQPGSYEEALKILHTINWLASFYCRWRLLVIAYAIQANFASSYFYIFQYKCNLNQKKKCNRRALKSSTVFELRHQLLRQIRSLWGQTELHNTPCSRFHLREKNVFSEELYWK